MFEMIAAAALASFICASPIAIDGDTLRCAAGPRVRLAGIDAPEIPGHCRRGRKCTPGDPAASTQSLAFAIRRAAVICRPTAIDRYRRLIARCKIMGIDLSCHQLRGGFAVRRYGRIECPPQ